MDPCRGLSGRISTLPMAPFPTPQLSTIKGLTQPLPKFMACELRVLRCLFATNVTPTDGIY